MVLPGAIDEVTAVLAETIGMLVKIPGLGVIVAHLWNVKVVSDLALEEFGLIAGECCEPFGILFGLCAFRSNVRSTEPST